MNDSIKAAIASAVSESCHLTTPHGALAKIRADLSAASGALDLDDFKESALFKRVCEAEQTLRKVESAADVLLDRLCDIIAELKETTHANAPGESWKAE
jgi:hypothetical protein